MHRTKKITEKNNCNAEAAFILNISNNTDNGPSYKLLGTGKEK